MLYAQNGGIPFYIHDTYESALQESKRLADKLDRPIFILQARQKVEKVKHSIEMLTDTDELPF